MNKVVLASLLAFATSTLAALPSAYGQAPSGAQAGAADSQGSITIKDPAEYNAYTNAVGQSSPAAKAQAIEAFLQQYPNSVVKVSLLEQLIATYNQQNDTPKTLDAARRLLAVQPDNLRALTYIVYVEKQQANGDQAKLDDAAQLAQKGLGAQKPADMSDADYQKLKATAQPIFQGAIAADDVAKKDYKGAIDAYTAELKAYPEPAQTQTGPGLMDTYLLGQSYLQLDPKDMVNGVWFLTRAAQFAPEPSKDQIEKAAEYWYNKYHGGMDGFDQVKTLAQANLFPPADYKPTPAPPPPSPSDQAHSALTSVNNDPKQLNLSDKEFILSNGAQLDADLVWGTLKGQTLGIPGKVISATADAVMLAVSQDAQQANTADFTINMKTPLKTLPTVGATVTIDATFDSYTAKPIMIILKDGTMPVAHHATTTTHRRAH